MEPEISVEMLKVLVDNHYSLGGSVEDYALYSDQTWEDQLPLNLKDLEKITEDPHNMSYLPVSQHLHRRISPACKRQTRDPNRRTSKDAQKAIPMRLQRRENPHGGKKVLLVVSEISEAGRYDLF